jgi:hypothetical protein
MSRWLLYPHLQSGHVGRSPSTWSDYRPSEACPSTPSMPIAVTSHSSSISQDGRA